jgi:RNA polymerase sigma factor (sigma-70 family)
METTDVPGIPSHQEPIPTGFWDRVLAYAKTKAQTADAEDYTQDAFLETLEKPADSSLSLKRRQAMVFGIVKNKHRHRRRHERVELEAEDEVGRKIVESQSLVGTPEFDAEWRQLRGLLFTAMSDLSPNSEQLVQMRFFDEMKPAEIATELHKLPRTIRTALTRALLLLREREELRAYHEDMES